MTFVPTPRRGWGKLRLAVGLVAAAAFVIPYAAAGQGEAGWLGLVEGAATVERAGVPEAAVAERPLVEGDRLTTARGARVEAVLADGTSVLVAGDSEVAFAAPNLLLLERGELLLTSEGTTETRIDTENATVYATAGSCRIERSEDATLVVAREGDVELRTRQGVVWLAAGRQAWVEGDALAVVEPAGDADALERWAAALHGRQELLAFEDDSGGDLASYDFPLDFWEIGEPVCVDHHPPGRAIRTRPPHDEPGPGSGANDPGRTAVSNDGDTGAAIAAIEIPVAKPWPLDDAGTSDVGELPIAKPTPETSDDDGWRAASNAGNYAHAAPSPAKEPQPSAAEEPETVSSSDDSAGGSSDTTDTSDTSDSSTSDTFTAVAETSPASPDPVADTTPIQDSGGSEPQTFEAPAREDPAIEPNR